MLLVPAEVEGQAVVEVANDARAAAATTGPPKYHPVFLSAGWVASIMS